MRKPLWRGSFDSGDNNTRFSLECCPPEPSTIARVLFHAFGSPFFSQKCLKFAALGFQKKSSQMHKTPKYFFPLNSVPFHWESNFEVLEHTVTGHMLYSIDYCCCQLFLVPKINVPQKMQWHMFLQQQLCRNFLCQDLCQRLLLWCV